MKNEITMNELVISVKIKKEFYDPMTDEQVEVIADKIAAGLERIASPDVVRQVLEGEGLDLNTLIIRVQD